MELSELPDANVKPLGEKQTELIVCLILSNFPNYFPLFTSHKKIYESKLPEANKVLSGEKQTDLIRPR